MGAWTLRRLGLGNATAVGLGLPMENIELEGAPWLRMDCGGEGLYESFKDGDIPRGRGCRVGMSGEVVALRAPLGMASE